jgi:hypothetical protein
MLEAKSLTPERMQHQVLTLEELGAFNPKPVERQQHRLQTLGACWQR